MYFSFVTLTIGLLVSLSANAYLLNELLEIREILDAQYETILPNNENVRF